MALGTVAGYSERTIYRARRQLGERVENTKGWRDPGNTWAVAGGEEGESEQSSEVAHSALRILMRRIRMRRADLRGQRTGSSAKSASSATSANEMRRGVSKTLAELAEFSPWRGSATPWRGVFDGLGVMGRAAKWWLAAERTRNEGQDERPRAPGQGSAMGGGVDRGEDVHAGVCRWDGPRTDAGDVDRADGGRVARAGVCGGVSGWGTDGAGGAAAAGAVELGRGWLRAVAWRERPHVGHVSYR